jgi:hypothetical protein
MPHPSAFFTYSHLVILSYSQSVDNVSLNRTVINQPLNNSVYCLITARTRYHTVILVNLVTIPTSPFQLSVTSIWDQNATTNKQTNSMVWVRERTILTERQPLVGEVIANFCVYMVPRDQRDGSIRPYSRFSRQEPLLFNQVAPKLYSRGWVDPVSDSLLFFLVVPGIEPGHPDLYPITLTTRPQRRSKTQLSNEINTCLFRKVLQAQISRHSVY